MQHSKHPAGGDGESWVHSLIREPLQQKKCFNEDIRANGKGHVFKHTTGKRTEKQAQTLKQAKGKKETTATRHLIKKPVWRRWWNPPQHPPAFCPLPLNGGSCVETCVDAVIPSHLSLCIYARRTALLLVGRVVRLIIASSTGGARSLWAQPGVLNITCKPCHTWKSTSDVLCHLFWNCGAITTAQYEEEGSETAPCDCAVSTKTTTMN